MRRSGSSRRTKTSSESPRGLVGERLSSTTFLECRPLATCAPGRQLGRYEDLLARHITLRHCLPHLFFVAVRRGGVDVAIPDLERAEGCVEGATAPRLPRTEPENRHLPARCEFDALVREQPLFAYVRVVLIFCHVTQPLEYRRITCDRDHQGFGRSVIEAESRAAERGATSLSRPSPI